MRTKRSHRQFELEVTYMQVVTTEACDLQTRSVNVKADFSDFWADFDRDAMRKEM